MNYSMHAVWFHCCILHSTSDTYYHSSLKKGASNHVRVCAVKILALIADLSVGFEDLAGTEWHSYFSARLETINSPAFLGDV